MRNINLTDRFPRMVLGAALLTCVFVSCAKAKHLDTVFYCPDAPDTYATSINSKGIIVGYCYYGPDSFIRYTDGSIDTFAVEYNTYAMDVNAKNAVTGYYLDQNDVLHGFERTSDGKLVEFDAPNSSETYPDSINDGGYISGWYDDTGYAGHGFILAPDETFTSFDAPNSKGTFPQRINASGSIVGYYADSSEVIHGFMRDASGKIKSFDPPGSTGTYAYDINSKGVAVGYFTDSKNASHGYIRNVDSTFTTFDIKGSTSTGAISINDDGFVAGVCACGKRIKYTHGFVRDPNGTTKVFQLEEYSHEPTNVARINAKGAVVGSFIEDGSGESLGFVRRQ